MDVVVYNANNYKIGGIETFIKNWSMRMCFHYNLKIVYETGYLDQLLEMAKYGEVIKYTGDIIKCDYCLWASSWGSRPINRIISPIHDQMIHADWEKLKERTGETFKLQPEIRDYIAVGKQAGEAFTRMTGKKHKVIFNLLKPKVETQKILRLITVSRIGKEKGFERLVIMARELKDQGIPFIWFVYGDIPTEQYISFIKSKLVDIPEVIFMGPKLNLESYIKDCDYLVQLSDTEAFCYSIYEARQLGVPVIATKFPSAFEQIKEGKSGYLLDFDMSNLDVHKIYNHIPTENDFVEFSSEKDWIAQIGKPTKIKKWNKVVDTVQVKVITKYRDTLLNKIMSPGMRMTCTIDRARELEFANKISIEGFTYKEA